MDFSNFLNESTSKKINPSKFTEIVKNAFGLLANIDISGKGGNQLSADVGHLSASLSKKSKKELFDLIVKASKAAGVDLVPSDESDKSGFVPAGPGGDDVLTFKINGNDYSENKNYEENGEFKYDLMLSLDSFILSA